MLHLLGIDHKQLTVRHNGIDRRLTDVHGHVVEKLLNNMVADFANTTNPH